MGGVWNVSGMGGVRENPPGIGGVQGVLTAIGVSDVPSGIGGVRGAFSGSCAYRGTGSGRGGVYDGRGVPTFSGSAIGTRTQGDI